MVLSKTSKRPHLVIRKKNGGLACDKDCPQYASAGFCSHAVAAAQHDNQLPKLVASYQSVKHGPNLMKLATCDMPKGRGRKGSKGPAKRKRHPQMYQGVAGSSFQSPQMYQGVAGSSFQSPQMYQGVAGSSFQSPHMYQGAGPSFVQQPFRIGFVTGNISVCNRCKGKYHKESGPPHDLCVQHEEWRTFTPSGSTTQQSRFGNVYYHCNVPCICAVWPSFVPSSIVVSPSIQTKLDGVHKQWLHTAFNITSGQ